MPTRSSALSASVTVSAPSWLSYDSRQRSLTNTPPTTPLPRTARCKLKLTLTIAQRRERIMSENKSKGKASGAQLACAWLLLQHKNYLQELRKNIYPYVSTLDDEFIVSAYRELNHGNSKRSLESQKMYVLQGVKSGIIRLTNVINNVLLAK